VSSPSKWTWQPPTSAGPMGFIPDPREEEPTYVLGNEITLPLTVIRPTYVTST
jgi:hypothetical protein